MEKSLNEETYEKLKYDIMNFKLLPGDSISAQKIALRYDVSRTPAREAIVNLEKEGLLKIIPQSGTYVACINCKRSEQEWFVRQVHLATEEKLPVIIHSRDASQDTFDIMKKEHAGTTGGVIHCFSGSAEMAKEYVKMGYYIGVGGVVTFKNSRVLKEVVKAIPLECIVVETDCPYLAPAPHRGKRNSSAYLPLVIEEIARLKEITAEEVENVTYENAQRLYGLIH